MGGRIFFIISILGEQLWMTPSTIWAALSPTTMIEEVIGGGHPCGKPGHQQARAGIWAAPLRQSCPDHLVPSLRGGSEEPGKKAWIKAAVLQEVHAHCATSVGLQLWWGFRTSNNLPLMRIGVSYRKSQHLRWFLRQSPPNAISHISQL